MLSTPASPSRSVWLVVAILAALVVLLSLAVLGVLVLVLKVPALPLRSAPLPTPTATPTATPTITLSLPAGFTAYADAGGLYTLGYPDTWTKLDSTSGGSSTPTIIGAGAGFGLVLFADASTGATFGIEYVQLSYPGGPAAFDDVMFQSFASNGTVANQQVNTTVSIGGESWTQESGDVTSAGTTQHIVTAAVSHGDYTIGILYYAPAGSFDAVNSASFQTMLSSFTFLK
jgi:hypothetical protein